MKIQINKQKTLLVSVLCFSFAITASAAWASMTFDTTTISSTGALNLNPTGQPVTVNGDLHITGSCTGCGGGIPAGADTQIQFNDSGSFGGDSDFEWISRSNPTVTGMAGLLIGNAQEPDLSCCNGAGSSISFINSGILSAINENYVSASDTGSYFVQNFYQSAGTTDVPANMPTNRNIWEADFLGFRGGSYKYLTEAYARVAAGGGGEFLWEVGNESGNSNVLSMSLAADVGGPTITIHTPSLKGPRIIRASSQTADLMQFLDSNGTTILSSFDKDGKLSTPAMTVGTGATMTKVENAASNAIDFPNTSAGTCSLATTSAISDAAMGDTVTVNPSADDAAWDTGQLSAFVESAGVVKITYCTGAGGNPGIMTYKLTLMKF